MQFISAWSFLLPRDFKINLDRRHKTELESYLSSGCTTFDYLRYTEREFDLLQTRRGCFSIERDCCRAQRGFLGEILASLSRNSRLEVSFAWTSRVKASLVNCAKWRSSSYDPETVSNKFPRVVELRRVKTLPRSSLISTLRIRRM